MKPRLWDVKNIVLMRMHHEYHLFCPSTVLFPTFSPCFLPHPYISTSVSSPSVHFHCLPFPMSTFSPHFHLGPFPIPTFPPRSLPHPYISNWSLPRPYISTSFLPHPYISTSVPSPSLHFHLCPFPIPTFPPLSLPHPYISNWSLPRPTFLPHSFPIPIYPPLSFPHPYISTSVPSPSLHFHLCHFPIPTFPPLPIPATLNYYPGIFLVPHF